MVRLPLPKPELWNVLRHCDATRHAEMKWKPFGSQLRYFVILEGEGEGLEGKR